MLGAHRGEQRIEPGEIDPRLVGMLGHSEPAADMEDLGRSEGARRGGEEACGVLPARDVENPAADVRLEADDPRASLAGQPGAVGELRDRHAELRARAGGAHVSVVAATDAGVDAHEDVTVAEELRPAVERVSVVDRHPHSTLERPGVLRARCEIRRIEDACGLEIGKEREYPLDLAARHALELDAGGPQRPQELRVRIGLDGVVHPRERGEATQCPRGPLDSVEVVHEGRVTLAERAEELGPFGAPPGQRRAPGAVLWPREQLLPGGTENLVARHRADQQLVQLLDQTVTLVLIDHEGEVQIVGRLAHEVDLLLLEALESAAELMEDRADVASHETHRGARAGCSAGAAPWRRWSRSPAPRRSAAPAAAARSASRAGWR